ncbi:MAG: hypothetical protein IKE85_08460 [Mogibacterium sp.]|nr:hypothetical protein [Mogibacterium sp.]
MSDNNNKPNSNNVSRHTWIEDDGNKGSYDVLFERKTYSQIPDATKLVEKQRTPYKGFITDEELENSKIIDLESRKTTLVDKDDISQTRIYTPFAEEEPEPPKVKAMPKPKARTVWISDSRKFKRLIAVLAVFVLLLLFELSFAVMKYSLTKLPAKTEAARTQTAELQAENDKLAEEAAGYGDYNQMMELKDSWERLKEKLGKSE